jgi:hypothetical protein
LTIELEDSIMSEQQNPLATVIPIGHHPSLFPQWSEARHHDYGWVIIDAVDGNRRLVRWYLFEDVPEREFAERFGDEPVIEAQDITRCTEWVDINTLRRVDVRFRPADWQSLHRFGALWRPAAIRAELERRTREARAKINTHQE